MATELPRIVSVDDHVIEPAHLFATWLPAKYRDRGPQALTAGIGERPGDALLAEVKHRSQLRRAADPAGRPRDEAGGASFALVRAQLDGVGLDD